mmetsp:Transcript_84438/g.240033  ORF Transcript_84438/g.240033 Transcript_84438/m.240033 type:complete len:203 (+) Transcript_84438:10054-10662(+)
MRWCLTADDIIGDKLGLCPHVTELALHARRIKEVLTQHGDCRAAELGASRWGCALYCHRVQVGKHAATMPVDRNHGVTERDGKRHAPVGTWRRQRRCEAFDHSRASINRSALDCDVTKGAGHPGSVLRQAGDAEQHRRAARGPAVHWGHIHHHWSRHERESRVRRLKVDAVLRYLQLDSALNVGRGNARQLGSTHKRGRHVV